MNETNTSALLRLGICLNSIAPIFADCGLRYALYDFIRTPTLDNLGKITDEFLEMQYEHHNHQPHPVTDYERLSNDMRSRSYSDFRIAFVTIGKLLFPETPLDDSEISSTISKIEVLFCSARSLCEAVDKFEPILGFPNDTVELPQLKTDSPTHS